MINGKFRAKLALIVVGLSFVYFFVVTLVDIPPSATRLVDTIVGFLMGTAIPTVIGFYFGSSDTDPAKLPEEK
jgi:hypothetical protein